MSFKKFVSPKRKTHKVQKNNAPFKTLKNHTFLRQKIEKQTKIATHIWTYENMVKF